MSGAPRDHLYLFAHRALPGLGLERPKLMLGVLCGPKCGEFLQTLWADVGSDLEDSKRMPFPDVTCSGNRQQDYLMMVIHFQPPVAMTEPYFSAFVFGPIANSPDLDALQARYFILEHGENELGQPRTVLCEWTASSHLNFGDGPSGDADAFVEATWKAIRND